MRKEGSRKSYAAILTDIWKEEGIAQPSLERRGLAFCAKGSKAGRQQNPGGAGAYQDVSDGEQRAGARTSHGPTEGKGFVDYSLEQVLNIFNLLLNEIIWRCVYLSAHLTQCQCCPKLSNRGL